MLHIKNLSAFYQNTCALDQISVTFVDGSITGIIGPNGAGKSTLLKGILNITEHQGQVLLDDKPLKQHLDRVAYVEQKTNIDYNFPIKVKECVSLGLYPQTKLFSRLTRKDWEKVTQVLKMVGLEDYAGRQISQLSGGQFQRVLLARCLIQEADYIFLDEPFVGIDSVSEEIIMSTLRQLKKQGKTILIVHHDLSKVSDYFDHVLLLNRSLIAFGETKETFTQENMEKAYGSRLFIKGGE